MTHTLYVARHGETDWNRVGRYQGRLDESGLTPVGEAQSQALSNALAEAGITRILASPLRRCVDTARPLATRLNLTIEYDARLLEIAQGSWEGRLRDEIAHADPERYDRWRECPEDIAFPGGESLTQVLERWRSFVSALDRSRNTLVITHEVLVRIAILYATGRTLAHYWNVRVVNAGYARFEGGAKTLRLLEECHADHLATGLIP